MKIESGTEGRRARVEMVPLLDVLLIVLIFFVYLALSLTGQKGVEVSLPGGRGHAVRPAVILTVTSSNQIRFQGRVVTPAEALRRIRGLGGKGSAPPKSVLLRSDRGSRLGLSIELLSRLEQAGVKRVSIEVDGK